MTSRPAFPISNLACCFILLIVSGCTLPSSDTDFSPRQKPVASDDLTEGLTGEEAKLMHAYLITYKWDHCGYSALGELQRNYMSAQIRQCSQYEDDRSKVLKSFERIKTALPGHLSVVKEAKDGTCEEGDTLKGQLKGAHLAVDTLHSILENYERGITCSP